MPHDVHDILDLAFRKVDLFQALWGLYITVVLGFLGYLAAAPNSARSEIVRVILAVGFLLFAYVNLQGLLTVQEERMNLKVAAKAIIEKHNDLDPAVAKALMDVADVGPPPYWALVSFHLASDVLMLLTILALPSALIKFGPPTPHPVQAKPAQSPLPPVILTRDQLSGNWVLQADYILDPNVEYAEGVNYIFRIPAGYTFDLASVPRWLWWLIAPFELSLVGPLIHDFIYDCKGHLPPGRVTDLKGGPVNKLERDDADDLFARLMRIEGVSNWRIFFAYNAVHIFGGWFWSSRRHRPVLSQVPAAATNSGSSPESEG